MNVIIGLLVVFCGYLLSINFLYHKKISFLEQKHSDILQATTAEYFKQLQKQYDELFRQFQQKSKKEFDEKLKAEYEKACDQIKFDEIEYKKTITKKRKEFNRKNGKDAKPERLWRYLDEEEEEPK
jgi:hypothetical protein